jgi:hypothetical protein
MWARRRSTASARSRAAVAALALAVVLTFALIGAASGPAAGARATSAPALTIGAVRLPAAGATGGPVSSRVIVHRKLVRPAITKQPQAVYTAPGSRVRFAAAASGYPKPTARWQISRNHGASWRNIAGARGGTFSFVAVVGQNGDEFRAVFRNTRGRVVTAPAKLTAVAGYSRPLVHSEPSSLTTASGANATFTAAASGDPAPTVQWELSTNNGASWSNLAGATSPTLSFLASPILSGDEFRALFTNVLGTQLTTNATLTVSGAVGGGPVVTQQPTGQDVPAGESATFIAAASGSPAPSVQWQVSTDSGQSWTNIAGATSDTFSLATTTVAEDRYEYQAVFTNAEGSATTDPAILGVGNLLTSNWSGYAAVGGGAYTAVSATWRVPAVTCPTDGSDSNSSQWVGIDGASDSTVEQDGTYSNCAGGTANYGAWLEMVGNTTVYNPGGMEYNAQTSLPSGHTVYPGDSITASVSVDDDDDWTFAMADTTSPHTWSYTNPTTIYWAGADESSAEWIVERPQLCTPDCQLTALANFGTAAFSNALANAGNGSQSIAALGGSPVQMIRSDSDSTLLAGPGALDGTGEIFSDTWYAPF